MALYLRGKTWWCEFWHNGGKIRESTRQTSRRKAQTWETDKRIEVAQRATISPLKKIPLLKDAAKDFLDEVDAATKSGSTRPNTKRHYHMGWSLLAGTQIADMRVDRITRGIASGLKFRGGPWSARKAQQFLSRVLRWCADERGYLQAAPSIKRTRAEGRKLRVTPEIEAALLEHLKDDGADIFVIMLDTFMRPAEVMAIDLNYVNIDRAEYCITQGKTPNSERYVPLSDRCLAILQKRKDDSHNQWAFPRRGKNSKGHRLTIAKQFEAARSAAGVAFNVKLYCARHEGATSFLEHGGDLPTLMSVMGHKDIATTNKYLHGNASRAREVVNRRNKQSKLTLVKSA